MELSEDQIVGLIKAQDEKGISLLYDYYAASLNGIIYRIVLDEGLAEELLQKTFLKVWNKIDTFDASKSSLFTWMRVIARNSAIDKKRLKSFEHRQKTESIDEHVYPMKTTETPSEKIDVAHLLENMDEKQRSVLDAIYLQGYSHSQAAEVLEIPIGTVKTRLRMAIKELRNHLKNEKDLFLRLLMILLILILIIL